MARANRREYRVAVDIGGTFTDVVVAARGARLRMGKAPTRADDPWGSISEGLTIVSTELELELDDLLDRTDVFLYATTRATNAILTGAASNSTAFVTTSGFPDILTLRNGGRPDPFDFRSPFPDPYVPRSLTFELPGRIDAQGRELRPFEMGVAADIVDKIVARGCHAVAVCLLWAQVNPAHELAFARVLEGRVSGMAYTLSHQLNPVIREYPRASATAIDASLKPLMQAHLQEIQDELLDHKFRGDLLAITSAGGCLPVQEMIAKPIYCIDSGPSVAPVAALRYGSAESARRSVVVFDTGGTSFDVSVISEGEIAVTRERWLGREFTGNLLGIASVGVHSIGAGGGSIASIDAGGLLRVGPESAGSRPGPACYGLGGRHPTVTDAYLLIGYLDPNYFLGGRLRLDASAAREAICRHVAEPLALDVESAAAAIVSVSDEAMVDAITEITVNQGVDPRECLLVAGGGAGGLNAVKLAQELGCQQVLVPASAGALSAVGAQLSEIVAEFSRSGVMSTADFDHQRCGTTFDDLNEAMENFGARIRSGASLDGGPRRTYFLEARYPNQVWDLRIPITWNGSDPTPDELARTVIDFHRQHEQTFAVRDDSAAIECQQWIGRMTASLGTPSLEVRRPASSGGSALHRNAWFDGELIVTKCVRGNDLELGTEIAGPAIVEEAMTTVVIPPGAQVRITELGNYLIEVESLG